MTRDIDLRCAWLFTESDEVCNKPATSEVTVKTKQVTATVPLCKEHRAAHDQAGAKLRRRTI